MAMNNVMRRSCPQERMMPENQCMRERMMPENHCARERIMPEQACMRERMIRDNNCPTERMQVCVDNKDKKGIARCVYEVGFVLVETMLYLDTHPNDREALAYFARMKEQYKMCLCKYNEICGPLQFTDVDDENYWTWASMPMPWEMEG